MVAHLASDQHGVQAHVCAEGEGDRGGSEGSLVHRPRRVQAQLGRHAAHLQRLTSPLSRAGREEALLPRPRAEITCAGDGAHDQ